MPQGENNRLGAIGSRHFLAERVHMVLHRLFAQAEFLRDELVRLAFAQMEEVSISRAVSKAGAVVRRWGRFGEI